ncbi:MAG TPA: SBBP repeat-containing protein, partial [Candidatus Nitrosotalea sp.]|nr:SBBP repeat-containing protein [Candidatus Nitrosotalea sp.]
MNVNRRWWGASVVRVRILTAGLLLLAAGCLLLASPHARQVAAPSSVPPSMALTQPASLTSDPGNSGEQSRARAIFASLPLMFEPNQGQANLDPADSRAKFTARGSGYSLYLGSDGAILRLSSRDSSNSQYVEAVAMKLAGANPHANLTAFDRLPGQSNYFLSNDPTKWHTGIPQFARVRYEQIYPGIDLVFYGSQGRLEYDFQVAPGSDPSQAELEFAGAKKIELQDGALILTGEKGSLRLDPPRVYQHIAGRDQPVSGSFVLRGANRAGFAIGDYDHSRQLVIDPVLTYSTYFGGTLDERNTYVAVDNIGEIYIAGSTQSNNLPASGSVYQPALKGTQNVYIAKLNPTLGTGGLIYVTYLGGENVDYPVGLAVDGAGNPFVAGTTTSTKFPTSATAYQ